MIKFAKTIPVTIQPFFWVLAVLIGWMNTNTFEGTAIWTFIILISVLVHEYGHALTAMAFGQRSRIELMGFGGLTIRQGGSLKRWQEFIVIMNGPIAGFLLAGLAWWAQKRLLISHPASPITYGVVVAFYVNVFWTIINLLPVQPMDGGKLLTIILEALFGLRGLKISLVLSMAIAAVLGIYFMIIGAFLAGSLFFLFMYESYQSWQTTQKIHEADKDESLMELCSEVDSYMAKRPESVTDQRNDKWAREKLEAILSKTKKGVIYTRATSLYAKLLAERGEFQRAYDMLAAESARLSPDFFGLLHILAYRLERWSDVVALGDHAYQVQPNYHTALSNAVAYGMLGQPKPAVGWLRCAQKEGLLDLRPVVARSEFNAIRDDQTFKDFLEAEKL